MTPVSVVAKNAIGALGALVSCGNTSIGDDFWTAYAIAAFRTTECRLLDDFGTMTIKNELQHISKLHTTSKATGG